MSDALEAAVSQGPNLRDLAPAFPGCVILGRRILVWTLDIYGMLIYLYACAPIYVIYIWENTWISTNNRGDLWVERTFFLCAFLYFFQGFCNLHTNLQQIAIWWFPFCTFPGFSRFFGGGVEGKHMSFAFRKEKYVIWKHPIHTHEHMYFRY